MVDMSNCVEPSSSSEIPLFCRDIIYDSLYKTLEIKQLHAALEDKATKLAEQEQRLQDKEKSLKSALFWTKKEYTRWYEVRIQCIKSWQLYQSSLLSRLFRPDETMIQEFHDLTGKDPKEFFEHIQTLIWRFNNDGKYGKYDDWMLPDEPSDAIASKWPADDYHGLHKKFILKKFNSSLMRNMTDAKNRRRAFLWEVICGRGKHSLVNKGDNDSVIKSMLMDRLQAEHDKDPRLKYWQHDANPGVIVVLFDYPTPL